jgi:hypothetical protein
MPDTCTLHARTSSRCDRSFAQVPDDFKVCDLGERGWILREGKKKRAMREKNGIVGLIGR